MRMLLDNNSNANERWVMKGKRGAEVGLEVKVCNIPKLLYKYFNKL